MNGLATLPGPELLHRLNVLVRRNRAAEAELLVHLGEVDARRLHLEQACPSMFQYCVRVLRFAEGVAFKRIQVARAARRHPELIEAIRRGQLHLTAASLLVPHLDRENVRALIAAATHRTADQVRALLADRRPRPHVATSVRRIPAVPPSKPVASAGEISAARRTELHASVPPATPAAPAPAPTRPEPLGQERYCVRFTADAETWARLKELRALMRHQVPDGDVGKILARAISALLAQVRKQKLGPPRPRSPKPPESPAGEPPREAKPGASRTIPKAIRSEVFRRDGGRCTYVSPNGRRCGAREFVEFHHRDPWARSRSHSAEGITLRCRAHNQYQAERDFGSRHMARFGKREGHPREPDLDQVPPMGGAGP